MKNVISLIILAMVLLGNTLLSQTDTDVTNLNDKQIKANKALWGLLAIRHNRPDVRDWASQLKKKLELSDEEFREVLNQFIKRNANASLVNGITPSRSVLDQCALDVSKIAMQVSPGDARLERTILDEWNKYQNDVASVFGTTRIWLKNIARYGSDECQVELAELIKDSRLRAVLEQENRKRISFNRGGFPEGNELVDKLKFTSVNPTMLIGIVTFFGLILVMILFCVVNRRHKRSRFHGVSPK